MECQNASTEKQVVQSDVTKKKKDSKLMYLYPITQFGAGTWKSYFSSYIGMLYTDVYLLPIALAGILELFTQFLDWFAGPIFGTIVDKVTFKRGKYWQWITIGSIATTLIYILIFGLPVIFASSPSLAFLAFFVFLLAIARSLSVPITDVTLAALYPRIADNPQDRSFLAIGKSVGLRAGLTIGGFVTPALLIYFTTRTGSEAGGWASTATILGTVGLMCYLIFILALRKSYVETVAIAEKDIDKKKKNKVPFSVVLKCLVTNRALLVIFAFMIIHKVYYFFQTYSSTYFFKYYINDFASIGAFTTFRTISQIAGVLLGVIWLKLFKDSKKAFVTAGILHIITLGWTILVVGSASPLFFIMVSSLTCFFAGLMEAFILPFFAAASDYGTWKTGSRADGLNMSIYPLALSIASASSIALRTFALNSAGYDAKLYVVGVVPSQEVLNQFVNLQTLYPFILSILAVALVAFFYPLNDTKIKEIKEEIHKRENGGTV